MPSKVTFTCAVCGAIKGEVNHWYTYDINSSRIRVGTFAMLERELYSTPDENGNSDADCVCGQKCLHAILDKWLAAQRTPKEIA